MLVVKTTLALAMEHVSQTAAFVMLGLKAMTAAASVVATVAGIMEDVKPTALAYAPNSMIGQCKE